MLSLTACQHSFILHLKVALTCFDVCPPILWLFFFHSIPSAALSFVPAVVSRPSLCPTCQVVLCSQLVLNKFPRFFGRPQLHPTPRCTSRGWLFYCLCNSHYLSAQPYPSPHWALCAHTPPSIFQSSSLFHFTLLSITSELQLLLPSLPLHTQSFA